MLTGRTLFGSAPSKGQELEEHYFGTIRPIVSEFMKDLDQELWKLGVPAKTKHNEVAPCQHELAPIYDTTNVAIDHNLLTMEMMKKIASKYGLVCLQHEKPFEGVNGSGKHNNWSMSTTRRTCWIPVTPRWRTCSSWCSCPPSSRRWTSTPTCCGPLWPLPATITVWVPTRHLRPSFPSSWAKSWRLSSTPSASDSPYAGPVKMKMDLGVDVLPKFSKDTTDRNRTSPFAFTGNKFEFRMPGSAQNLSDCDTILNTAVAKS